MPNSAIEIVTIVAYLLILVAVGLVFRSMNRDASDYFRSGCQGTWWLVGASAFMSGFSAWTFTGAAGVAFEAGWSVSVIFLANAFGFLTNAVLFAPWFRQLRAITVPEVVRDRFGVSTQQFYAWANVPLRLLYSALHLYGLAIFSAAVFGLDLQVVIFGVGLIVLIYSVFGGSWAVMATDFLQTLVLLPLSLLMAGLCLMEVGGLGGFFQLIQDQGLSREFALVKPDALFPGGAYTWAWAAAMFLQAFFMSNSLGSASRYFAAKDGAAARKAAWLGAILMLLGGWIWFIPPMVARLLYEADVLAAPIAKPAEAAYAVASVKLLPNGMTGLMVVAMFSATMSSLDTGLNQTAAIFTQDICPTVARWFGKTGNRLKTSMRLGQGFSLVLGLAIIALAMYFSSTEGTGIFEYMLDIGAMLGIPLSVPLLMALFIRRAPWWSALFSTCAGIVPSILCMIAQADWSFQRTVFVNVVAGVLAFVATMPFWRLQGPGYRRDVARFFRKMHTPVDFRKEVGVESDLRQLKVIGIFGIIIGLLIGLLVLMPNSAGDRWEIASVAAAITLTSSLLLACGRSRRAPVATPPVARDTPLLAQEEADLKSSYAE